MKTSSNPRRRCSIAWAGLLLLLALPAVTQAQFTFTTNNGAITITGYTGSGGDVIIPDTINGLPVTSIGIEAFAGSTLLKITIPDSVTNLTPWYFGIGAFDGSTGLSAINEDAANPAYSSVDGVLFDKSQTTLMLYPPVLAGHYTIPTGVTSIGNSAFIGCSLAEVRIPASVSYIGAAAFAYSPNLKKVFCEGNAPSTGGSDGEGGVFVYDNATVYYLPGTTGWFESLSFLPTELWLPQLQTDDGNFGMRTNQFGFNIAWASGQTVVVEACTNLSNPVWLPVATNTLTSDSSYFSDPQPANLPARFYRLKQQ